MPYFRLRYSGSGDSPSLFESYRHSRSCHWFIQGQLFVYFKKECKLISIGIPEIWFYGTEFIKILKRRHLIENSFCSRLKTRFCYEFSLGVNCTATSYTTFFIIRPGGTKRKQTLSQKTWVLICAPVIPTNCIPLGKSFNHTFMVRGSQNYSHSVTK